MSVEDVRRLLENPVPFDPEPDDPPPKKTKARRKQGGGDGPYITGEKGDPLAILANAITALRVAPEWRDVIAYDEFGCRTLMLKPSPWEPASDTFSARFWSDVDDIKTAEWLQRAGIRVTPPVAADAVQAVGQENRINPVRTYLEDVEWDGVDRLDEWVATYLGAAPPPAEDGSIDTGRAYLAAVGAKWMISAVARVFRPGCKVDCMLVLEGPQGARKSSALATLAGSFFSDDLADLGSKAAAEQLQGVWIVELAELDSLQRVGVTTIKSFLSRQQDVFRPSYGRRALPHPRQCVFAGSGNRDDYLRDATGARRFWPVVCGTIEIAALERDRDLLWAEAVHRYRQGETWWLEGSEAATAACVQDARYEGDPWEDPILQYLDRLGSAMHHQGSADEVLASEVLEYGLLLPPAKWQAKDQQRVAAILSRAGWERRQLRRNGRRQWFYVRPAVTTRHHPSPPRNMQGGDRDNDFPTMG